MVGVPAVVQVFTSESADGPVYEGKAEKEGARKAHTHEPYLVRVATVLYMA
jgi:hypothetical protein